MDYFTRSGDTAPTGWEIAEYVYDPAGRRIEKKFDGVTEVKYLYDGSQCIAEYDGDDNLLRKYIYGPGIDQPICMIEPVLDPIGDQDSNAVSYYHYDGLGSVVALSDEDGETIQVYEYDVYGNVAASDPNHTNPFMFTGRRMDTETGLYFYRARTYNPALGRFLQTDSIGYEDGMNLYWYCRNNPLNRIDPYGHRSCDSCDPCNGITDPCAVAEFCAQDPCACACLDGSGGSTPESKTRSLKGRPRVDKSCEGICQSCLDKFPEAMRACWECCFRQGDMDPKESEKAGVECVQEAVTLGNITSIPGLQPVPGAPGSGVRKSGLLFALGFLLMFTVVCYNIWNRGYLAHRIE